MAAPHKKLVVLGLVLAIAITAGSEPRVANGEGLLCGMSAEGLRACQSSVSGSKPQVPPSPPCCSALDGSNLKCLCRYKSSGLMGMYNIDPEQAMALPGLCKIKDPSWHC